jgi:hypothetical protein
MPSAENAQLYMEFGQTFQDFVALTDSGDHLTYESGDHLFSKKSGFAPTIRPNGVINGLAVSVAASGSNDVVDVSAGKCYLAGVETSVNASADESLTRATPSDTHIINSITVDSGGSIAVVAGTDHTEFSETRGANGGPPLIPTGSIELAQVRLSASGAAVVVADEIFSVPNVHRERYDYPTWQINHSNVENLVLGAAGITFDVAPMLNHTGPVTKAVYARYYTPIFGALSKVSDFVPAENTHSVSSVQIYGSSIGAASSSVSQGSFTAYLETNIDDPLLQNKDETLWFKYLQDSTVTTKYVLTQGKLGVTRSNPAGDNLSAACTITPEVASQSVTSEASL